MDLFRKSALQRMLSPEQLDQLIQITRPRDWVALLGICAIIITIIIWSIWGTITLDVQGSGILIKPGGYLMIESPVEGQITKVSNFNVGDIIHVGQTIAEIAQPLLQLQIQAKNTYLANLEEQKKSALAKHSNLVDQIQLKIVETQFQLQLLQDQLRSNSKILSPYSGSFLAMRASDGTYVKAGDSILSMEHINGEITVALFLPPNTTNINSIKPGKLAKILLGLGKNTENGYLIGQVRSISRFPVSSQIMANILNNDYLVKYFSEKGPPYLVYVDLLLDPQTKSGYKWSSDAGKTISISSGTFCSALIQIATEPPINLLIPNFRKVQE